jgi:hypothetical protein
VNYRHLAVSILLYITLRRLASVVGSELVRNFDWRKPERLLKGMSRCVAINKWRNAYSYDVGTVLDTVTGADQTVKRMCCLRCL